MTEPRRTPLAARHESLDARMVDFHGWWMPIQYEGIVAEHQHTRSVVSAFDVSHMGQLLFRGEHAARELDRVVTRRVSDMPVGRCRYALLLNEGGGIEDDLLVYRVRDNEYMLVANASTFEKDAALIQARVSDAAGFEDASSVFAMIAVQGPRSKDALASVVDADLSKLEYYRCAACRAFGREMTVSRTGYTGELGYELCFDATAAEQVWDAVLGLPNVKPAGLGARDTLRLEMGMPLYGADLTTDQTPAETGLMFAVDLDREFVGRDAVAARVDEGPKTQLVGFEMLGRRAARPGHEIQMNGETVGRVTSGCFGPSVGRAIGMGYVRPDAAAPGTALTIDVRGKALDARTIELPFYSNGSVH